MLADTALRAHDIDEAAAVEAQRKAEEALRDSQDNMDFARAQAELAEAAARLKVLRNLRETAKRGR